MVYVFNALDKNSLLHDNLSRHATGQEDLSYISNEDGIIFQHPKVTLSSFPLNRPIFLSLFRLLASLKPWSTYCSSFSSSFIVHRINMVKI